jgi:hypothetical protein
MGIMRNSNCFAECAVDNRLLSDNIAGPDGVHAKYFRPDAGLFAFSTVD